ncbi:Pycsar system effector family protein [Spirosoma endbachense]|uniref:Pycsar effector protein domain-containing protein n=1 Tax=Spirosoma endbachense TaxID=2666025 RepID=A0A6P1W1T4_9BACT|nr:Pycsar system effector family protein [Spirosoma endbachense]QHV99373.1 hypothetical protein GJR95_32100 [Spirosoma endbachense]
MMEIATVAAQPIGIAQPQKQGKLLKKARQFAWTLYQEHRSTNVYFHTYTRAEEVVKACRDLAKDLALNASDRKVLFVSAWFVDTGFVYQGPAVQLDSDTIVESFLQPYDFPTDQTKRVIDCINSVHTVHVPTSALEEAFHDGYWQFLGRKDYENQIDLLRAEQEQTSGQVITEAEWTSQCLADFTKHPFYSRYAQQKFSKQRAQNWLVVERKLRSLNLKAKQNEKPVQENRLSDHEIEDSFKLASRNYVDLLGVADRKAALLINVSSILISIVLAVLIRHLEDNPRLVLPTIILLVVCMATITFAILASRPTRRQNRQPSAEEEQTLFLGSYDSIDPAFERTTWEDYSQQVDTLRMQSKNEYFKQVLKEIFRTRKLLSRKFRYLSVAYYTFIVGMVITTLAYVTAMLFDI